MVGTIWFPKSVVAFLHIWNLLAPLKITITSSAIFIYAGVWGYTHTNPFTHSPLLISVVYAAFMLPFYASGIVIASYVWRGFKDPNLTRYRYIEVILILQTIYIAIIWILLPCPFSADTILCIPIPSTGIIALLFASKVIEKLDSPWTEPDSD